MTERCALEMVNTPRCVIHLNIMGGEFAFEFPLLIFLELLH